MKVGNTTFMVKNPTKLGAAVGIAGLGVQVGLASYYDLKSVQNSDKKGMATLAAVGRGLGYGILGGVAGRASASGLLMAAKSLKKMVPSVNKSTAFYRAKPVNDAAKMSNMVKDRVVRFVRIRGRIVPIKLSKEKKEQLKGAGIAAAGAAVTIEAGNTYRKLAEKAMTYGINAIKLKERTNYFGSKGVAGQMSFDDVLSAQNLSAATKAQKTGKMFASSAIFISRAAPIVGGGMIAYGTSKFLTNLNKDKDKNKISPEVASALGLGAGALGMGGASKAREFFYQGFRGRQQAFKFYSSGFAKNIMKAFK